MKKILSLFLAVLTLLSCVVFAEAFLQGDIDGDEKLTASDARLVLRYAVNLEVLSEEQIKAADVDGNGKIQASDARLILRRAVGLPDEETPSVQQPTGKPTVQQPAYEASERELAFRTALYETAHPLLGSYPAFYGDSNPLSFILKNFQKWCCLYTINYVFRPALQKAGYTEREVDLLAPNTFSRDSLAKLLTNVVGFNWSDKFVVDSMPLYVPSLLADYYLKTPNACDTYIFHDFYDDMIELKVYERSEEDVAKYTPRVGDVLFISNKSKSYVNGYPTVDHTAQIIEVYKDGTFLCSEGSLLDENDPTGIARVQERRYMYDAQTGTYCYRDDAYIYRGIAVLFIAQPKLSYK